MFISVVGWCVYTHSVDGEVFYVGMGNGDRPFAGASNAGTSARNELWHAVVARRGGFDVSILKWFGSRKAALSYEKKMIALFNPSCNKPMCRGNGFRIE